MAEQDTKGCIHMARGHLQAAEEALRLGKAAKAVEHLESASDWALLSAVKAAHVERRIHAGPGGSKIVELHQP